MRVAVIGAGAVGGTLAALLHRAGHEVDVTARGENLRTLQEDGLLLTGAWGTHTARVAAAERLGRPPELALVTAKIADAADAMSANAGYLRGIPVVVVQNGLEGVRGGRRALPHSDVVGGLALFAASLVAPGRVSVTAAAETILGVPGAAPTLPVLSAVELLDPILPVRATANFEGAQWTKLVINGVNAVPAITGLSVQATLADPALRAVVTRGMQETVRVGVAAGIRFDPISGLGDRTLRAFARLPVRLAQAVPARMGRRMGATPNPGSTLQSIRRGRPTEVDGLNGAVVAQAARLRLDSPVNAALVAMVHEVEASRAHLPVAEVVRRVAG
ncbi:ketopantoate reductase family protein [Planctomonas deserti]|uniref:ketopantoate reductase family protein n=1 Tax=Planctomonas deserti TaxID=2144185 RepID=UPI000D3A9E2B|nr:2-dehydropantoate 2-reductase [Planctomonas deserti]